MAGTFAYTRGNKTRRSITAPNLKQCREQPSGLIHLKFVNLNPDAVQSYSTFEQTCAGREYDRDFDQPSRHVCSSSKLRRKVNQYPDADEEKRLRVLIIRSGLQWSHVTRNSTIACVKTDIRTRKSGLSQPASRPILCNRDGTEKSDSAAGDIQQSFQ
ncbi:MAG: hypothetical protein EZS28_028365 [Streblomastix strix]|uniref:Uncharacterized protein n=1 Tax=Streblomastix strix TaxID=222440 RepID=A0A5J4V054_9EUKA|nr:MAG: hypothetical protein EZS28_028365 [Streblomastix strix]